MPSDRFDRRAVVSPRSRTEPIGELIPVDEGDRVAFDDAGWERTPQHDDSADPDVGLRAGEDLIVKPRGVATEDRGESGNVVGITGIIAPLDMNDLPVDRDHPAELLRVEEEQPAGADQHVVAVAATGVDVVCRPPAFGEKGRDRPSRCPLTLGPGTVPANMLRWFIANPQVERYQPASQEACRELQLGRGGEEQKQEAAGNGGEKQPAHARQSALPPRSEPVLVALLLKTARSAS